MTRALLASVAGLIAAEDLFRPGDRVAVAVSGGSDSVGLLLLLQRFAPQWGLQLSVLHFDHQLRPASGQEAEFVRQLAEMRGLACRIGRDDVRERMRQTGRNLEEAARQARYSFFWKTCAELGIGCLATGHTADDQAETVLLHLLRGSGPAGLAGIWPKSLLPAPHGEPKSGEPEIRLLRPLLSVRRTDVRAFLESEEQRWIDDPSNVILDRSRNRIRHQLLPQLCRDFNPALVERLCATADILRGEEDDWAVAVAAVTQSMSCYPVEGGGCRFDLAPLRRTRLGLRRRVLRALIRSVQDDLRRVDFYHTNLLLEWIGERPPTCSEAGRGSRRMQFAGVAAEVTAHELILRPRRPRLRNLSSSAPV